MPGTPALPPGLSWAAELIFGARILVCVPGLYYNDIILNRNQANTNCRSNIFDWQSRYVNVVYTVRTVYTPDLCTPRGLCVPPGYCIPQAFVHFDVFVYLLDSVYLEDSIHLEDCVYIQDCTLEYR
jgi:hypothetical protein